jgi:hypothetical protein
MLLHHRLVILDRRQIAQITLNADHEGQKNTEKSEISEQLKGLREQLTLLENKIKIAEVPVIITFDG